MTRNQLLAHIILHWVIPRLKREKLTWNQCPISPEQLFTLVKRMTK